MERLPYLSRRTGKVVVDYLCRCGGKWSEHEADPESGERHGGGLGETECLHFCFSACIHEQNRIPSISNRPCAQDYVRNSAN